MKKFLLFLYVCCAFNLHAQQFKLNFSPTAKIEDDVVSFHKYGKFIYSDKVNQGRAQMLYTANLKKIKHGIELTQYDEQVKEIKTLSLDNGEKDFGPFQSMVHYGKSFIYVVYFKFLEDDRIKMFVTKINPQDFSIMDTKELMEYNQKNQGFWGAFKTVTETQVFFTVSPDGRNMWIVHASPTLFYSSVIDADLNIVEKAEAVTTKMKKLTVSAAHLTNEGNKVLLYYYDNPALKDFYTRGVFFQTKDKKGTFKDIRFPDDANPGSLDLLAGKDGNLYFGGEYYSNKYAEGGKGVSLGQVDIAKQSVSTPTLYPYTDELKERVRDLDFASKKKGDIVFEDHKLQYSLREMQDGTIVLSTDMHTSSSTSRMTFYFVGPIINVFVKPGGTAVMTLIPKKQSSESITNFMTYTYQDKFVCIYSDIPKFHQKEFSDKQIGLVRGTGDMVPVANVYSSDGKLISSKLLLDDARQMKGNIMIGNRSRLTDNTFVFPVGETKTSFTKYYTKVSQLCYLEIL